MRSTGSGLSEGSSPRPLSRATIAPRDGQVKPVSSKGEILRVLRRTPRADRVRPPILADPPAARRPRGYRTGTAVRTDRGLRHVAENRRPILEGDRDLMVMEVLIC